MSSSSRARPFSFSAAVRDVLGPPGPVNDAVRRALPSLFDGSVDALLRIDSAGSRFPRVVVREGRSVPAGTPVGLFAGHVFVGPAVRGDYVVALPPMATRGGPLHLGVDAAASLARYPSPSQAGLYAHACDGGSLVAEWRALDHRPSFSVLVAVAVPSSSSPHSAGTSISTVWATATLWATTMAGTGVRLVADVVRLVAEPVSATALPRFRAPETASSAP